MTVYINTYAFNMFRSKNIKRNCYKELEKIWGGTKQTESWMGWATLEPAKDLRGAGMV